jgi:hypothetical protein
MSSTDLKIVEAFGKFVVETEKGPKFCDTIGEAEVLAAEFANGAANRDEAIAYTTFAGLDGKNAQGKVNVITAYIAWVDSGRPAAPIKEEEVVAEEAPVEAAADEDVAGDDVEF